MSEWLTPKEAAAYVRLHPKTLYRYVRAGKLQEYRPGGTGRPRFRREDLDALLGVQEQRERAAQGEP